MRTTALNFSIERIVSEAEKLQSKSRIFRIYAHSPSLFELLSSLADEISGESHPGPRTPNNETWSNILQTVYSYRQSLKDCENPNVLFYLGQVALLLDCIKLRDAYAGIPRSVRLFV